MYLKVHRDVWGFLKPHFSLSFPISRYIESIVLTTGQQSLFLQAYRVVEEKKKTHGKQLFVFHWTVSAAFVDA